jgi:hypothetical protein
MVSLLLKERLFENRQSEISSFKIEEGKSHHDSVSEFRGEGWGVRVG